MILLTTAEHFVRAPQWTWWILAYFFFAGLCGGSYALATILRWVGDPKDEPAVRVGYYVSLVTVAVCPLLLTADLAASWTKFWHMLVNVTPGGSGLIFKYWSPMSVGAWALLVFALFAGVSALDAYLMDRRGKGLLPAALARAFAVVGTVFALFVASYTGVLLSVSNQPVWSDTWALGGLFLASGLSGSAALMILLARYRAGIEFSIPSLARADGYFTGLEILLLVLFFITLIAAGTVGRTLPMVVLWMVALAGMGASLYAMQRQGRLQVAGAAPAAAAARSETLVIPLLVLVGVLALRAAVIFSAQ